MLQDILLNLYLQYVLICLLDLPPHSIFSKKEEIWLSPITKYPTPKEKFKKKQIENRQNTTNMFDYTAIAADLKWWSNSSQQTGVVKPMYGILTCQITTTTV